MRVVYSDGGAFFTSAQSASMFLLDPVFLHFIFLCVVIFTSLMMASGMPFLAQVILFGAGAVSSFFWLAIAITVYLAVIRRGWAKALRTPILLLPMQVMNVVTIDHVMRLFGESFGGAFSGTLEIALRTMIIFACLDILHGKYVSQFHGYYVPPEDVEAYERLAMSGGTVDPANIRGLHRTEGLLSSTEHQVHARTSVAAGVAAGASTAMPAHQGYMAASGLQGPISAVGPVLHKPDATVSAPNAASPVAQDTIAQKLGPAAQAATTSGSTNARPALVSVLPAAPRTGLPPDSVSRPVAPEPQATSLKIANKTFDLSTVHFIKSEDHYLVVQQQGHSTMVRGKLREIASKIDVEMGVQINRSVWIAYAAVAAVNETSNGRLELLLKDDSIMRVAESRRVFFMHNFGRYRQKNIV